MRYKKRRQLTPDDIEFIEGAKRMTAMTHQAITEHIMNGHKPNEGRVEDFINPILGYLQVVASGKIPAKGRGFYGRIERQDREGIGSDYFLDYHEFLAKYNDIAYTEFRDKYSPGRRLRDSSWNNTPLWWAQEALLQAIVMYMRDRDITTYGSYRLD